MAWQIEYLPGLLGLMGIFFFALVELTQLLSIKTFSNRKELFSMFMIGFAGINWLFAACDRFVLQWTLIPLPLGIQISGTLLFYGGVLIRFFAFKDLGKFYNIAISIEDDHQLIKTGLYKHIRHPLYLGTLLLFLGFPIAMSSLGATAGFVFTGLPVIYYRIKIEEKILIAHFGQKYLDYKKTTGALFPWF
ncbi:MAG: isoprenylcysteine carboxylmethyltransferase family protein [Deltaproteobacteria bacterium]|jgi:protein-S-isoprenylcysteine O-methyltransferase Ste14|nr:isoprenylcysteine carboxylmethyltransferase family protein [Deltaproteobacteria bacterium]